MRPDYGETWAYESIIGALPGVDISPKTAIAIQLIVFETAVLALAWYYDLWGAAAAGTAAVVVAAAGSVEILRVGDAARDPETPEAYRRLLFSSSIEVVLSVLVFVALVTHLFVFDPRHGSSLVTDLFGAEPPMLVVYLMLLIFWDLCYRIGTGWWASVVGLWRSLTYRFDAETTTTLLRADRETLLFGFVQLLLVPFVLDQPVLLVAIVGHVIAVTLVSGASILLLLGRKST